MKVKKRLDIQIYIIALSLMMAWTTVPGLVKEVISKETTAPGQSSDTLEKDQQLHDKMSRLRIPFIANEGQIKDDLIKYYARTFGGTIYVTEKGEIVYSLPGIASDESTDPLDKAQEDKNMEIWVLRENLIGAYEIHPEGMDKARTKVNSFIGSDKNRWKTNISTYNNLSLGRVYDGIDLGLKAYGNNVEKVFTVYPTGEVSDIELKMDGASSMSINHDGELELETDLGPVKFSRPVAYQEIAGEREPVEVAYNIKGTTYGFQVAEYNNDYPLIIDPLLASTFIGGTSLDAGNSIALDSSGNIYVTGITQSSDYPATSGAYDEANNGGTYDVFVSKLTSDLTTLSASTFIGGGDYDYSFSIALDSANNVYITGYTESSDYPTTSGAYDEAHNGDSDVFVSKLTSDLTTLSASTFIGGSMSDRGHFFALDSSNNVYVTGYTYSWDYPTTSGAYDEVYNASYDVFISKLTSDLATLSASTFIGGGTGSDVGYSIALDDSNNVYVTGDTDSSDYPITSGAYDETSNGSKDVFVSKLTADLATLSASTFIGGSSDDEYCRSIALDSSDNVYVIGNTDSSDYPTTSGAYDETFNGGSDDVFVSKLTADLATLSASTYIGGASLEDNRSLALDGSDNVYVTGQTESSDYPTTSGAYDEDHTGVYYDAFISKLTSNLTTLSASTFIGGAGYDYARAIALDSSGNVYVTGMTESSDYAVTSGAYDEIFNGGYDVFVSKLSGDLSGEPGVVFVNGDNTGTEDGDSWDTGYSTIQAGIDAAVAGDEIWVKQGTYQESIGLVENNVSLYGGFDGTETLRDERDWINNITTIDGMTESGVIQNYSTGIVLDGFTITNGNATASSGGGIYNDYGEIIIQNCTFYGNYASGNGGAIYNYGSDGSDASVTLIDCVFDNNSAASYGGAIYNYYSMVNMTGCTFQNNSVTTDYSYGGAVYNMSANNTITNCTFENNSAVDYGGAFYNRDSDISITGSSFTENVTTNASAGSGGAIYNYRSSPVITDCSFTRNSTGNSGTIHGNIDDILGYSGGAIFYYYSTSGTEVAVPNITNCTFEENEAQYGGAIGYEYDSSDTNLPTASITNCRFINNWAPFYSGAISIIDIGSGDYGEPEIINCLFTGNVSDIGGVSRNQDGEPLFLNCTFSGNTTNNTTYGSTIENSGAGQIARFINCIFWGNSTANGQEIYNEGTVAPATPVISYSNIEGSGGSSAWDTNLGTDGGNNIDADPLFVSASDYHLQTGSPSIDTGDNSQTSLPATDIEGNTRIQNSIVDMGPYEYEYVLQQYSLTMQVSGSGSTTPSAGTYAYDSGTNVDLEAIPDTGYEFAGWSGDLEGTTNPTTITVDSDKIVTANFILMTHSLSVNIVGSGSVSLDPTGGSYNSGTEVTLTANPETGWQFTGWSGDLTGTTNPKTITMDSYKTVTATFIQVASNNPPSAPTAVTPEDEAIMESGAVMISASDFTDSDVDDTHMESYWMVRRADSVYGRWDYDESFDYAAFEETSDDLTTHTLEGLLTGMKYIWKVGYTDSGGETPVWSEEYSFKVGTSVSESMPEVYSGIDIADFTIMSFPFWLDDPSALVVFDIDYDTRYFRIGRYVPDRNGGEYVELDDPSAELNPGEAVWILARDGLEVVVDGIPVSVETDIEVALYYNEENGNGWNQIGCPNDRNYPWAELEVTEYNEYGDIIFGPTPLGELGDPNDYIDLRVWRWIDGDYESFTPDDDFILEVYEGYWVKVKRDNIYLKFPEASQIAGLTNNDTMFAGLFKSGKKWIKDWILTSPVAVADSGDSPPMPMGGFTSESGAEASGEGGGGGCFIATAAYGSPMERHVRILREFRDKVLLSSGAGIRLVNLYYRHSPPLADYVAAHDGLRSAVRVGLLPLVGMGYLALNHPILLFLVLFASCLSFVYVLVGIYRGYANIN